MCLPRCHIPYLLAQVGRAEWRFGAALLLLNCNSTQPQLTYRTVHVRYMYRPERPLHPEILRQLVLGRQPFDTRTRISGAPCRLALSTLLPLLTQQRVREALSGVLPGYCLIAEHETMKCIFAAPLMRGVGLWTLPISLPGVFVLPLFFTRDCKMSNIHSLTPDENSVCACVKLSVGAHHQQQQHL